MVLIIVGGGVSPPETITLAGMADLKGCDKILIDIYTTQWDADALERTRAIFPIAVNSDRTMLEDVEGIIRESSASSVGILTCGDPFIATTHQSLRDACIRSGVKVVVHYSSSFLNVLLGELGLHIYKIGFVGTVMKSPPDALYPIYAGVKGAYLAGKHSILLMGSDGNGDRSITPNMAIDMLMSLDVPSGERIFTPDLPAIVSSRMGRPTQEIWVDTLSKLSGLKFGEPPYSMVIPARLHFTELDILKRVCNVNQEVGELMGREMRSTAHIRAEATIAKTKSALLYARANAGPGLTSLLENVGLYLDDAETFLNQGKDELALVESSYAEGLLDALRFQNVMDIKW